MEMVADFVWGGSKITADGDYSHEIKRRLLLGRKVITKIEARSPTLQADSLPAKPPEKPKNTGVGNLSPLQGIFPTQESNQGFLHCRWILSQLSYQGSPIHRFHPPVKGVPARD